MNFGLFAASTNDIHISIAAEPVFYIGSFPVTNGLLTGVVGSL